MKAFRVRRGKIHLSVPLRPIALGVALSGMLVPVLMQTPERLTQNTESMIAGAGATLSASVPENPYNTLAQQLQDEQAALNEREAELKKKENNVGPSAGEIFGVMSFVMSVILLGLLGLNFYMDSRRNKRPAVSSKFSVDLR